MNQQSRQNSCSAVPRSRRLILQRAAVQSPGLTVRHSRKILALDVEFAHFKVKGTVQKYPAEVCVVGWDGLPVYHSHCKPSIDRAAAHWVGGVKMLHLNGAPTLTETSLAVSQIIAGHILVGHGLQNDLAVLGVGHSQHMMRDTMQYSKFQRKSGHAYTLRELAQKLLNRRIQLRSQPHSAREDAEITMLLYRRFIANEPSQMHSEAEMVDMYLSELLESGE